MFWHAGGKAGDAIHSLGSRSTAVGGLQFIDLVRYVFGSQEVPAFMDQVWWSHDSESNQKHYQELFRHLALGYGIRGSRFGCHLTKQQAKRLCDVPHHFEVADGLRWLHGNAFCIVIHSDPHHRVARPDDDAKNQKPWS